MCVPATQRRLRENCFEPWPTLLLRMPSQGGGGMHPGAASLTCAARGVHTQEGAGQLRRTSVKRRSAPGEGSTSVRLRILLRPGLHVTISVLVGLQQLEGAPGDADRATDAQLRRRPLDARPVQVPAGAQGARARRRSAATRNAHASCFPDGGRRPAPTQWRLLRGRDGAASRAPGVRDAHDLPLARSFLLPCTAAGARVPCPPDTGVLRTCRRRCRCF